MTINFTARYIDNAKVLKSIQNGRYEDADLSIVELNNHDTRDLNALKRTTGLWDKKGAKYARAMYYEASSDIPLPSVDKEHYFAVTEQKDDFTHLEPEKVLGLMIFDETNYNSNELAMLEVEPSCAKKNGENRKYKQVGSALVNYIKKSYNDKNIIVFADVNAIDFYKKNGFENMYDNSDCQLYWKA